MTTTPLPEQIEAHRDRMWRRDVSLPRNVQKDEETRLTWYLKDEVMRRGRVYYAKLAGGRSMFVAPRLISHFAAIWMPRRKDEPQLLSDAAQRVLKVLRREHELATADLRAESRVTERAAFTRALDELQRQMKVDPTGRHLSTVFLHLDPSRRPFPGRAEKTDSPQDGTARDRSSVSGGRRDVGTRRDSARFGFEPR